MPDHYSVFVVKHDGGMSRDVAFAQAMEIDAAVKRAGAEPAAGHYAVEDSDGLHALAAHVVFGDTGTVNIARCPEHGLHGERAECFICGGPVEQVPMRPVPRQEQNRG